MSAFGRRRHGCGVWTTGPGGAADDVPAAPGRADGPHAASRGGWFRQTWRSVRSSVAMPRWGWDHASSVLSARSPWCRAAGRREPESAPGPCPGRQGAARGDRQILGPASHSTRRVSREPVQSMAAPWAEGLDGDAGQPHARSADERVAVVGAGPRGSPQPARGAARCRRTAQAAILRRGRGTAEPSSPRSLIVRPRSAG